MNLEASKSPQERERLCRLVLEGQGLRVIRFWIDGDNWGHAITLCENGKQLHWSQNPNDRR